MASTSPRQQGHSVEHERHARCGGATRMRGAAIRRAAGQCCVWENGEWMEMAGRASLGLGALALGIWSLVLQAQQRYGPGYIIMGKRWKMPISLGKIRGPVVICRPFIRPHLVVGFWDINCYVGPSDLNQFRTSRIADFLSKKKKIPLSRSLNREWLFSCNRKLNDIAHVDAGIV